MTTNNTAEKLAPLAKNIDDVAMIQAAIDEGRSVSAHQRALVDQFGKAQIETEVATPETVSRCFAAAVALMAAAFHEPIEKLRGDNGKLYAPDRSLPSGVEDTGEIVVVEKHAFMIKDFASCIVWKAESKVAKLNELIGTCRAEIRDALQNDVNGTVNVQIKADYLERLIEQRELSYIAFEAASVAYSDVVGEPYETRAMRDARKQRKAAAVRTTHNPALERARQLGVEI